jgi:hypothetical protein
MHWCFQGVLNQVCVEQILDGTIKIQKPSISRLKTVEYKKTAGEQRKKKQHYVVVTCIGWEVTYNANFYFYKIFIFIFVEKKTASGRRIAVQMIV